MSLGAIIDKVKSFGCKLVELTGGEPLLQKNALPLMTQLCDLGYTVLLETSGAHDIASVDPRVIRIMDLKTPGSGECDRNRLENIGHLKPQDEVKFVIGSREDYEWARATIAAHKIDQKAGTVLFSPVFRHAGMAGQTAGHPGLDPQTLVDWLLEDHLPVRFQLQLHKFIWPPTQRGV
jgi:7-carboxy-7-deazaguanine synthase